MPRPIDADALCERLSEKALSFSFVDECTEWTVRDDIQMVQEAPTLSYKDLVPQGEWVKRPNTKGQVYCSECATLEEITDNSFKSMFCPGCGARMKGGESE